MTARKNLCLRLRWSFAHRPESVFCVANAGRCRVSGDPGGNVDRCAWRWYMFSSAAGGVGFGASDPQGFVLVPDEDGGGHESAALWRGKRRSEMSANHGAGEGRAARPGAGHDRHVSLQCPCAVATVDGRSLAASHERWVHKAWAVQDPGRDEIERERGRGRGRGRDSVGLDCCLTYCAEYGGPSHRQEGQQTSRRPVGLPADSTAFPNPATQSVVQVRVHASGEQKRKHGGRGASHRLSPAPRTRG
ncbi:hypothetical protein BC628DRAFT_1005986 [Trametes gibbosa]|nr:hypothetical protein BC628DRAFT_1005986 [Trametes gibbosa]